MQICLPLQCGTENSLASTFMSSPSYDVIAMLEAAASPAKLLFSMWEYLSPCDYSKLYEEERVVLDAWNFDSALGNGINDLIANENYDVLANGVRAMRLLGLPRLGEFVDTLERTFREFGIDSNSGMSIATVDSLSHSQRVRLRTELEMAEAPYLDDLWQAGVLTLATHNYLLSKLSVFKKRKQGDGY